jgi:predicted ATP-grasp superfamily ATP-dependent carboligase
LASILIRKADVWAGRVLLPTGDLALETLSRHRDALSTSYRLCVPSWDIVRLLLRKDETARIVNKCGIGVPVNYGPADQFVASQAGIRWPVLIKPNDSTKFQSLFGKKVFVANNATEFEARFALVRQAGISAQILDLIPGPDSLCFNYTAYFDVAGRIVAEFPIRKIRKSPPFFGIGRVVESLHDGEIVRGLRESTIAFVKAAGWHGPVSAEFKLDPRDGRLLLIEVNGRCSFVQQLALHAGIDYAWLAYQEAAWGAAARPSASEWNGVLIHLHADLLNAMFFGKIEALTFEQFLAPYFRRKAFAVWNAGDPLPFFAEWGRTLRESIRLAGSRGERQRLRDRALAMPLSACKLPDSAD